MLELKRQFGECPNLAVPPCGINLAWEAGQIIVSCDLNKGCPAPFGVSRFADQEGRQRLEPEVGAGENELNSAPVQRALGAET